MVSLTAVGVKGHWLKSSGIDSRGREGNRKEVVVMRKIVILLFVVFLPSAVMAGDWDKSRHNFRFESRGLTVEVRVEAGNNKAHIQLTKKINDFELAYRYAESTGLKEHRGRMTYRRPTNGTLYAYPRLEYRFFEGDVDDYFRFRTAFGVKHRFGKIKAYAEFTPMWKFGRGQTADLRMDQSQEVIGFEYKFTKPVSFGPFIQLETDNNFNRTGVFAGTNFTVKF